MKTVTAVLDIHCPVTRRIHKFKSQPPWYSEEIHIARRKRRKLERKWVKSKRPEDHKLYLDEIHSFSKLVRLSKQKHYMEQLSVANSKTTSE